MLGEGSLSTVKNGVLLSHLCWLRPAEVTFIISSFSSIIPSFFSWRPWDRREDGSCGFPCCHGCRDSVWVQNSPDREGPQNERSIALTESSGVLYVAAFVVNSSEVMSAGRVRPFFMSEPVRSWAGRGR